MVSSIGIHPCPTGGNLIFPYKSNTNPLCFRHHCCRRRRPHTNYNNKTLNPHRLSAASTNSSLILHPPGSDSPGKIDSWLQDSIPDIVTNLKHAPLLVQIHSDNNSSHGGGSVRIQTEKAVLGKWVVERDQWRNGESKPPDGLIYVDELGPDGDDDDGGPGRATRAWGVVVEWKGSEADSEHACYLLKTDKVLGGNGLGFCTHFYLMKVNNFRDTALEQFQDSWLLQ